MSEMVERVARALHSDPSEGWSEMPWEELPDQHRERLLRTARAAIEAMREPTTAVLVAGELVAPPLALIDNSLDTAVIWRAMIDAILAPSTPPTN